MCSSDLRHFCVLGGDAESIQARMTETFVDGRSLDESVRAAVAALSGPERLIAAGDLEVAVLSRSNGRRCFRRLDDTVVASALA